VEDDEINALVMQKLLEKDFEIHLAFDGDECLEKIGQQQFDIILMDVNLGNGYLDGVEVMQQIKALPGYMHIPVIAVTSFAMQNDKEKFLTAGFNGYLAKPIEKDKVFQLIHQIL
jgi:CheY-like chemotaxis protein